jgi:hypothetical protein
MDCTNMSYARKEQHHTYSTGNNLQVESPFHTRDYSYRHHPIQKKLDAGYIFFLDLDRSDGGTSSGSLSEVTKGLSGKLFLLSNTFLSI